MNRRPFSRVLRTSGFLCLLLWPVALYAASTTRPAVGERVPSEDAVLKDLHSLGLINGQLNIFRCACPVRDIAKGMGTTQPSEAQLSRARLRMNRLYDLGIRTVFSFQDPGVTSAGGESNDVAVSVALERAACIGSGIRYVWRPMANAGPNSMQTMTDQQVMDQIDPISVEIFDAAREGGVAFHCSAGHDRTGIVAAYIRLKYQHWPVDQAIDEMRRYGHNWPKFSADGGVSSWHEQHLRAIDLLLKRHDRVTTTR
ncbi:MAG: tyrosine-protein phosphatase [Planctomycetota bacterium]|nr:tyrosine-protein phosphatase [Planctomycetota bacterium]